jgi:hypothetical protein
VRASLKQHACRVMAPLIESFRRSRVTPKRVGFGGGSSCCMRRFENDSTLEMQSCHCSDGARTCPVDLACVVAAPRLEMG